MYTPHFEHTHIKPIQPTQKIGAADGRRYQADLDTQNDEHKRRELMPRPNTNYVKISIPKESVEDLRRVFSGTDIEIEDYNGYLLMTHPLLQSDNGVEEAGKELSTIMMGLFRLATGSAPKINAHGWFRFDEKGKATVYGGATATVKISATAVAMVIDSTGKERIIRPTDQIPSWFGKTIASPTLTKAVRLYESQGATWPGLYKVYEAIREAAGDPSSLNVVSKRELKRFTQTANSYEAIGDDARHAKPGTPPHRPMTLGEARNIIGALLTAYLSKSSNECDNS